MDHSQEDLKTAIFLKIDFIYASGDVHDDFYSAALKKSKDSLQAGFAATFAVEAEKKARLAALDTFISGLQDPSFGLLIASEHPKFGNEMQMWPRLAHRIVNLMLEANMAPQESAMLALIGKIPKGSSFSDEDSRVGCSWMSLERDFFSLLAKTGAAPAKERLLEIMKTEADAERFSIAMEVIFDPNMRRLPGTPDAWLLELLCSPALFTRNFTSRSFVEEKRLEPGAALPADHNMRHTVIAQGIIKGLACAEGMEFNGQFEEAIIREAEYKPQPNVTLWHCYVDILGKVGGELSLAKMKEYLEAGKNDAFYTYNVSRIAGAMQKIKHRISARRARASGVAEKISALIPSLAAHAAKRESRQPANLLKR
ncbi:MAG: hypothetical protein WC263_00190 [Candidatus Micrarchaeia archaeon]|jgi:hypothetical protein